MNLLQFNIKQKIIATNFFILIITIVAIFFIVIGGFDFTSENIMIENYTGIYDSVLTNLREVINMEEQYGNGERYIKDQARSIAAKISRQIDSNVVIYSSNMEILASTLTNSEINIKKDEIKNVYYGNKMYIKKTLDNQTYYCFLFPISNQNKIIGIIGIIKDNKSIDIQKATVKNVILIAFFVGVLIILLLSIFISARITKPLYVLKKHASEIAKGNYDMNIEIKTKDEVGELTEAFNNMAREIKKNVEIINIEKLKLDAIINGAGEGIIAVDSEGNIIAINNKAKNIIDSYIKEILPKLTNEVIAKKNKIVTEMMIAENNYLVSASPLKLLNNDEGAVFIFNDVTELRQLQEKQKQFVTDVSHELKTPLTVIMGYVEILSRKSDDKDAVNMCIHHLKEASERLQLLINDLIDLSILKKYEFEIEKVSIDLSNLINDIISQMNIKAQKYAIEIKPDFEPPIQIMADPLRIKQVIINILDNAIKYSCGNEIKLSIKNIDNYVQIVISDNGVGIPEKQLYKLFEPFYRVDKTRSRKLGGHGLGLSIVKEIVEKHGGLVEIASEEGKGTSVIIKLPISPSDKLENTGKNTNDSLSPSVL